MGLNDAYQNYSDTAFPYYLFGNMQVIAGMIIFTAVFVAAILYLRRRWVLPFGTITLMTTLLAVLFPFFSRFTHPEFIVQMIVAGLILDGSLGRLPIGRSAPRRIVCGCSRCCTGRALGHVPADDRDHRRARLEPDDVDGRPLDDRRRRLRHLADHVPALRSRSRPRRPR